MAAQYPAVSRQVCIGGCFKYLVTLRGFGRFCAENIPAVKDGKDNPVDMDARTMGGRLTLPQRKMPGRSHLHIP